MSDMHQTLMDKAYDTWKANEGWGYEQFVATLGHKEKLAVLTGNLNYQVQNGGFSQWHDNGYSSEVDQLLVLLGLIKNEPIINEVVEMVEKVMKIINDYERQIDEVKSDGWLDNQEEEIEDLANDMDNQLGQFDSKYYEIDDKFMSKMEEILSKM